MLTSTTSTATKTTTSPWNRRLALALAIGACGLFWLGVLPWIAAQPRMKSHLQWLDDRGVDPSAMYYTELEVMEEILARQQR
jgi:hypothetical protein